MPLKRSEVEKVEGRLDKAIYNFLKKHRDEVFSEEEIIKVLQKKGLISDDANYEKRVVTTKVALARLIVNEKVRKYLYQREEYFGIKI